MTHDGGGAGLVPKRICVITTGSLTTCPRMLRAADALAEIGHHVRVVSVLSTDWAVGPDHELAAARRFVWCPVDLRRQERRLSSAWASGRRRAMRGLAEALGARHVPLSFLSGALTRGATALVRAAAAAPADLVYAGTVGGLGVGTLSAVRLRASLGLDLEDLYAGDLPDTREGALDRALIERLERATLPRASFMTGGSVGIAAAYGSALGVTVTPIHNVLPRSVRPPAPLERRAEGRRLFWFSQTIGPGRGLEDVIRALGLLGAPAVLSLQGRPAGGYFEYLVRTARQLAPRLRLRHLAPTHPDRLADEVRAHDIGLALEPRSSPNKELCLSNKALTYITSGLSVVLSDTQGQRRLAEDLGAGALLYPAGHAEALAERLRSWVEDDLALDAARRTAFEAAARRWHWEHPLERGALLAAVERALRGTLR